MMKKWIYLLSAFVIMSCMAANSASSDSPDSDDKYQNYSVIVSKEMRDDALRRAKVWMAPPVPIESFDFLEGVPAENATKSTDEISCRWLVDEPATGYTPKFRCQTGDGERLKVKYAKESKNDNPEVPAEIAASRLLTALGFGADHMYTAKRVRCWGCPDDPYSYALHMHSSFENVRNNFFWTYGEQDQNGDYVYRPEFHKHTDFSFVSLEHKFGEHSIETKGEEGWKWEELQDISTSGEGSSRAEVDAFILMAVFLQHTDSKANQQRLVCLKPVEESGYCPEPMLIIQDVGATFGGPFKLFPPGHDKFDFESWQEAPMWKDRSECIVDIEDSPVGTFEEARISEEGRLFLGSLLARLSSRQIYNLFRGARAHQYNGSSEQDLHEWGRVFEVRRSLITDGDACPR